LAVALLGLNIKVTGSKRRGQPLNESETTRWYAKINTLGLERHSMAVHSEAMAVTMTKPCPICDHHMALDKAETVPWSRNACGERLTFRCEKCGVTQTQWNATAGQPQAGLGIAEG
jgi:hypothetical protein